MFYLCSFYIITSELNVNSIQSFFIPVMDKGMIPNHSGKYFHCIDYMFMLYTYNIILAPMLYKAYIQTISPTDFHLHLPILTWQTAHTLGESQSRMPQETILADR